MPRKLRSKLKKNEFYCVFCRRKIKLNSDEICLENDKRGRPRIRSKCNQCDYKVFKYIKFKDVDKVEKTYGWC